MRVEFALTRNLLVTNAVNDFISLHIKDRYGKVHKLDWVSVAVEWWDMAVCTFLLVDVIYLPDLTEEKVLRLLRPK